MPKIRSLIVGGAVLALSVLLGATPAQLQEKKPIKIGLLAPLTGPLASPGAEMVNGFRQFWNSVNNASSSRTIMTQSAKFRRLAFILSLSWLSGVPEAFRA